MGNLALALSFAFVMWVASAICIGPDLFLLLAGLLMVALLILVALVLAVALAIRTSRRPRILPLATVCCCLVLAWASGGILVDLHLICRVYMAGGPESLSEWGQNVISERAKERADSDWIDRDRIPMGVRTFLPGRVSVGGTIWSDLVRVRIELGGGFYHYGVVVYPRENTPMQQRWQRVIGWPSEVAIYREE